MFHRGPEYLRKTANMVLDALLQAVHEGYAERPISYAELHRIVEGTKTSADLDHFYRASFDEMQRVNDEEQRRKSRVNAFGRLVVHPLEPHFESGALDRRLIGNFFFFIRSLFGDQLDEFVEAANAALEEFKASNSLDDWSGFYNDPRMKRIFYLVMARVVKSFRVFDARRDWVIKVMQHDPTSTALSSTVFVERHFDGQALPFGDREFHLFFESLIRPLRDLSGEDQKLFVEAVGEESKAVFGDFLGELARMKPIT